MWEGLHDGDIYVLMVLGHGHNSLVRMHWHGHIHGVWFILWAEHDLMPSFMGVLYHVSARYAFAFYMHITWFPDISRGTKGSS